MDLFVPPYLRNTEGISHFGITSFEFAGKYLEEFSVYQPVPAEPERRIDRRRSDETPQKYQTCQLRFYDAGSDDHDFGRNGAAGLRNTFDAEYCGHIQVECGGNIGVMGNTNNALSGADEGISVPTYIQHCEQHIPGQQ